MLDTVISCTNLSVECIEKEVFDIINSGQCNTDDSIINTFIDKHLTASNLGTEQLSNIRVELNNFMYGCGNIQIDETHQRSVKQRRESTCTKAAGGSAIAENEMELEEISMEQANDIINVLQITLENTENEVNKNPPNTARQVLSGLNINKQMMTHCITAEQDPMNIKQPCASEQKCNYFCFVSRMDPKGSTPIDIVEIIYCLDMMQKYYDSRKKSARSSRMSSDQLFDIPSAICNNAKSTQKNGAIFHKIYVQDEAITVPLIKMKLFIEHASTGGESPLMMFFMFLVVEVPVTFDFVDAVYKSCNQNSFGKEKYVSEEIKRLWVNIAHRHQTFSGKNKNSLDSILKIQFNDIFDPDSPDCFWKLFRIPRCIQQARQHMHMWSMDNITTRSKITADIANVLINIRFGNIDKIFGRHCPPSHADNVFVGISNLCASAYSAEFDTYRQRVMIFMESRNKKKHNDGDDTDMQIGLDDDQQDDANGSNEMPIFDPPIVFSTPTYIDWDHEETVNLLLSMSVNDTIDMSADSLRLLDEHKQKYPDSIKMQGFPVTNMVAYIDPSMLLPHSSTLISFSEWLVENKDCALPDQMTIAILVLMHQKKISNHPIFSNFVDQADAIPRNILTLSDLRNSFLNDTGSSNRMMYRRATNIRDKQMQSIKTHAIKTQRGYAFQYYIVGTVYPLSYANARSDTGHYGGRDRIASVLNEIGEYQNSGSEYQSCIAEGFHKAYETLQSCKNESEWKLELYEGTLQHTIHMWKASIDHLNKNFRLKANNIQLFFRLQQSDIGVRLCYLVNGIGPSPNGIGLPNYIKNFGGNILRKAKRTNTQFEVKNGKDWGTGADNTMAKFLEAQSPANNHCPECLDISMYAPAEDWRGTTEAGTWHAYTVTYNQNGKAHGRPGELPIPMYCNEMPAQDSRSGGSAVNIAGRLCQLLPRNTEVDQAGKRTFTIKNEKTGNFENAEQRIVYFFPLLCLAQNCESDNQLEQTLNVVCTTVAAGAVDIDDADIDQESSFRKQGYNDMGDNSKFTVTKNDKTVAMCKRLFAHDVRAVCVSVSNSQWRGYFPDSKAGVETSVFDILANYVYMHTQIQSQDARISAQRGRETQKAQARLPPTALYMHSCNALLRKNIHNMTWADITYNAALNWIIDPAPLELVPLFIGTMIENTFDWGFWLILAILADYFETPRMDIEHVESMFASEEYIVPLDISQKTRKWLATFGIGLGMNTVGVPPKNGDVLFRTDTENDMEKSSIYITSKWDSNMSCNSAGLSCNLPITTQQPNKTYQSSEQKDSGNTAWRISEHVANVMYTKYQKQLRSACNISSPEALTIMVYRYMNMPISYPKFGKPPCGYGFQSWNSVLESLRCNSKDVSDMQHEDSGIFIDGFDTRVRKCIAQNNHSYLTSAWTFINREGSIFSFGVEPRMLILARAMIGQRPLISQNSVQSIFDHFVKETITHRIPSTLYPYTTVFTGMPDSDSMGLSLQVLDLKTVYAARPTTLFRALPCACVKEMAGSGISGVISGEMVEDIAVLNKYKRMAGILDMDYKDLHMTDITPPALPFLMWLYVETVQKPDTIDHSEFNAATSPYQKTAIFLDPETKTYIKCKSYTFAPIDDSKIILYSDSIQLTRISQVVTSNLLSILDATTDTFIRYAPIYCRNGVLVHIENIGFLVLKKWKPSDIKILTQDSNSYYFNPNTMSYLAISEGIDIHEDTSYMTRLQCDYDTYTKCVKDLKKNAPDEGDIRQNYSMFKSVEEIQVCLSSRQVEDSIIHVGSVLYIDVSHASIPEEIVAKLRFCKVSQNDPLSKMYGLNIKKFQARADPLGDFCPVIECMLLYEMPESIVPQNDYCDIDSQVWVGIRQMVSWSGKNKYTTRYITVPTKALVSTKKLSLMGKSIAIFQSIVKDS